uniref:Uncharacterized protein n=1 Tax=Oryza glumipatula TaxID=40148 RepID=A0A0D9ZBF0_9ORYZ
MVLRASWTKADIAQERSSGKEDNTYDRRSTIGSQIELVPARDPVLEHPYRAQDTKKATAPSDDDDEEEKDNDEDYIVHCVDEIGPSQLDNAPQPSQHTQQYNTCNQLIKLSTLQIIRLSFTFSKAWRQPHCVPTFHTLAPEAA